MCFRSFCCCLLGYLYATQLIIFLFGARFLSFLFEDLPQFLSRITKIRTYRLRILLLFTLGLAFPQPVFPIERILYFSSSSFSSSQHSPHLQERCRILSELLRYLIILSSSFAFWKAFSPHCCLSIQPALVCFPEAGFLVCFPRLLVIFLRLNHQIGQGRKGCR